MRRDRWVGMLPGLLLGAASIAKSQGMFGGGLTDAEKAGNNAGWANMGHGRLPDGSINPMLMHDPMKLPGASLPTPAEPAPGLSLAGAAPRRVSAIPIDIRAPQQAPQPQFQPQQASISPDDSRAAFLRSQGVGVPQQPAAPPGLLSDQPSMASLSPDEQSRRRFSQLQGIGPAMNIAMR